MNQEDWAVVVGVRLYPGLSNLGGPENDARAFRDWLIDPNGGAVPPGNMRLIVSSCFHPEPPGPPSMASSALPTMMEIIREFEQFQERSGENERQRKGVRVGRRLYLYFAGHGFSPRQANAAMRLADTALLTANATRRRPGHHVPGPSYANFFRKSGYFDEVLLFMDCCRNDYPQVPLNHIFFRTRLTRPR